MATVSDLKRTARQEADAGRLGVALDAYRRALRVSESGGRPADPLLHVRMADLHQRLGHERMAVASYGRAADGYRDEGRAANAIAVWKRVLRLFPRHVWVHHELSDLHLEQGLVAEARRHLLAYVREADERGEPRAAIEALEAFLEVRSDEEVSAVLRAYAALQRESAVIREGEGDGIGPASPSAETGSPPTDPAGKAGGRAPRPSRVPARRGHRRLPVRVEPARAPATG